MEKGKGNRKQETGKRTKENFSIGEEGNSISSGISSGDGNRVMVVIREKKGSRNGPIERGKMI